MNRFTARSIEIGFHGQVGDEDERGLTFRESTPCPHASLLGPIDQLKASQLLQLFLNASVRVVESRGGIRKKDWGSFMKGREGRDSNNQD